VHLPLLRGSLLTAALLVFVDVMKELPATLVMRPFNFDTLATQAYHPGGRRATGRGVDRRAGDRGRRPAAHHPAGPADLRRAQPGQFLLEGFVAAVTQRTVGAVFAAAEIHCLAFLCVYLTGVNSEPLWLPSQKGCDLLLPQEHQ
jgi:hypothetical protein